MKHRERKGEHPAIVMAHGLSGVKEQYRLALVCAEILSTPGINPGMVALSKQAGGFHQNPYSPSSEGIWLFSFDMAATGARSDSCPKAHCWRPGGFNS